MVTCLRCGRSLKDPESVKRRMGPACWKKAMGESEAAYQKMISKERTVTDPAQESETMQEIWRRVLQAERKECWCGTSISRGSLETCDHPGGYPLKGFGRPQWIWVTCPKCGYQMAYWKLHAPPLDDLSPEDPPKGGVMNA